MLSRCCSRSCCCHWSNNTCRRGRYGSRYTVTTGRCTARGAHDGRRYGRVPSIQNLLLLLLILMLLLRFRCCRCGLEDFRDLKPTNVTTTTGATAVACAAEWRFCCGYGHCWKVDGCCCCSIVTNRGITCATSEW